MKRSIRAASAVAFAASGLVAVPALASGTYYDLGANITVSGASADGSVAAAYSSGSGLYYSWTAAGGLVSIGGQWMGGVASVSWDGLRISGDAVGQDGTVQAAYYDRIAGSWTPLGGIGGVSDGDASSAWGISGDGSSVVGLGWINAGTAHAVQSMPAGTLTDLGSLGGSSRANGVDYDGSVIVGWQETSFGGWQGSYWAGGVATLLYDNDGNALPEAGAVSADGTWIVGVGGFDTQSWRYNTATHATEYLGDLDPFGDQQAATGLSADGSIVVGYDRGFGPAVWGRGSLWIEGQGMLDLTDYVTSLGVDLQGRVLALPMGISADGSTVYGLDSENHGFVVTLTTVPEPGTWPLLALGLAGMAALRRRRTPAAR